MHQGSWLTCAIASVMSDEKIIQLEPGYQKVYNEGVSPFLTFVDSGEREFFKAKDFVQLYE